MCNYHIIIHHSCIVIMFIAATAAISMTAAHDAQCKQQITSTHQKRKMKVKDEDGVIEMTE